MKRKSNYWRTLLILFLLTVLFALIGLFPDICDFYTDHIYCYICDGISMVTNLVPFAIGEILMYIGVFLLLLCILFLLLLIFLRKKKRYRHFCAIFYKSFLMSIVILLLTYMLTWFIPFRGTLLGKGERSLRTDYSYEEVSTLLNYIIDSENAAAEEIDISSDGKVEFPSIKDNRPKIAAAMRALDKDYPRLSGYYPQVKTAICSDILERMWIAGYNYPFTMEPTHSKYISPLDQPVLDAHELSHHKGYYKENEANFLSEIALSQSDDPFLRLSALDDMKRYIYEIYYDKQDQIFLDKIDSGEINIKIPVETQEEFDELIKIKDELFGEEPVESERLCYIINAALEIEQEIYSEDSHPLDDIPSADEVISTVSDVGWDVQEDVLEDNYYDDVTLLLLQYYDGILY